MDSRAKKILHEAQNLDEILHVASNLSPMSPEARDDLHRCLQAVFYYLGYEDGMESCRDR